MFCTSGIGIQNNSGTIGICNTYQEIDCTEHKYDAACILNKTVELVPCESFGVSENSEYKSIVTEFSLVCAKQFFPGLTQLFHLFGVLFGGFIVAHMLKKFVN